MSLGGKCPPWKRIKVVQPSDDETNAVSRDLRVPEYEVWKPDRLNPVLSELTPDAKESLLLCKSFTGILNRLTWENFEKLSECVKSLKIDTPSKIHLVVDLIHKRAIADKKYRILYVQMCDILRRSQVTDDEKAVLASYLVSKCELFFSLNLNQVLCLCKERKEMESRPDKNLRPLKEAHSQKENMYRKNLVANCEVIGELFKFDMIHPAIIFDMFNRLSKATINVAIECICTIITTIGLFYEEKIGQFPENYFTEMESILKSNDVPVWVRFHIQELLELKKRNWRPKNRVYSVRPTNIPQKEDIPEPETNQVPIPPKPPFEDRVNSALKTLTPENITSRVASIIPIENALQFEYLVDVIFQKASSKPDNCELYAKLCNYMWNFFVSNGKNDPNPIEFKTVVACKCQRLLNDLKPDEIIRKNQEKEKEPNQNSLKNTDAITNSFIFVTELIKMKKLSPAHVFNLLTKIIELKIEESFNLIQHLLRTHGKAVLLHLKYLNGVEELFQMIDKLHQPLEDEKYNANCHWKTVLGKFIYEANTEQFIHDFMDKKSRPSVRKFTPFMLFFYLQIILNRYVKDAVEVPYWIHLHEDEFSSNKGTPEAISRLITFMIGKPSHLSTRCGLLIVYFTKWGLFKKQNVIDGVMRFLKTPASKNNRANREILLKVLFESELFKPDDLKMASSENSDPKTVSSKNSDPKTVSSKNSDPKTVSSKKPLLKMIPPKNPRLKMVPSENSELKMVASENSDRKISPPENSDLKMVASENSDLKMVPPKKPLLKMVPPQNLDLKLVASENSDLKMVPPEKPILKMVPPEKPPLKVVPPENSDQKMVASENSDLKTVSSENSGLEMVSPKKPLLKMVPPENSDLKMVSPQKPLLKMIPPENSDPKMVASENSDLRTVSSENSGPKMVSPKKPLLKMVPPENPNVKMISFKNPNVKPGIKDGKMKVDVAQVPPIEKNCADPEMRKKLIRDTLKNLTPDNFNPLEFESKIKEVLLKTEDLEITASYLIELVTSKPDLCEFHTEICFSIFSLTVGGQQFCMVLMKSCTEYFERIFFRKDEPYVFKEKENSANKKPNENNEEFFKSIPIRATVTNSLLWRRGHYLIEMPGKAVHRMRRINEIEMKSNCPKCNLPNRTVDQELMKIHDKIMYCRALVTRLFETGPVHLVGRANAIAKAQTTDYYDVVGDRYTLYMPDEIYNAVMKKINLHMNLLCPGCGCKNGELAKRRKALELIVQSANEVMECVCYQVDFKLNELPVIENIMKRNQDGNKAMCRFFSKLVNKLNNETADNLVNSLMETLLNIHQIELFCEIYLHLSWKKDQFEKSLFHSKIPELVLNHELKTELLEMLEKVAVDYANR